MCRAADESPRTLPAFLACFPPEGHSVLLPASNPVCPGEIGGTSVRGTPRGTTKTITGLSQTLNGALGLFNKAKRGRRDQFNTRPDSNGMRARRGWLKPRAPAGRAFSPGVTPVRYPNQPGVGRECAAAHIHSDWRILTHVLYGQEGVWLEAHGRSIS
ncbi:hypothetical protein DPEC_G00304510 [Dallia pectoralis]|uniref:Uncharacterized protein n=1 Tax=Dallia pectoralis TaxID=75939 RepID=A0ACC2FDW4_DALPE|nr:hypothetical protein DPEC_G00304510 [Dallia pectoralis]